MPMTILEQLIATLSVYTTLTEKEITKMFKEELKECNGDEEQAAKNVLIITSSNLKRRFYKR